MGKRGPRNGSSYSAPWWEHLSDILVANLDEYMNDNERRLRHLREELARLRAAPFAKAPLYTLAWYVREIERLEAARKPA